MTDAARRSTIATGGESRRSTPPSGANMTVAERAKNIVLTPRTEWDVIATEQTTTQDIYSRYVMPLAAIAVGAWFIGAWLVGVTVPRLGTVTVGFWSALILALLQFCLSLVLVYVVALIIDALAPTFGGRQDRLAAFKVAAYSMTPAWLAGIFSLIPELSFLSILGLYGAYLLYLGLPRVMHAPENRAGAYAAVVVLAALVLVIVFAVIVARMTY
jgi:Yip1 domain